MEEYTLGLIIGRFQPFHNGHKLLINRSLQENPFTLVLVGSSETHDEKNPYTFSLRKKIILAEISEISGESIFPLPDFPTDSEWKNHILNYIPKHYKKIRIYCGDEANDSAVIALKRFTSSLPFYIQIIEIPRSIIPISATKIREYIKKSDKKNLNKYIGKNTYNLLKIEENLDI